MPNTIRLQNHEQEFTWHNLQKKKKKKRAKPKKPSQTRKNLAKPI
jgi:hypothetical protein